MENFVNLFPILDFLLIYDALHLKFIYLNQPHDKKYVRRHQ